MGNKTVYRALSNGVLPRERENDPLKLERDERTDEFKLEEEQ